MASSGANMLLSAAGSTSSGASSLAGRTHRRSFAPTVDGLNAIKTRSLSAAINPNSRLHAPHKINTIAEDEEHNNQNGFNNNNLDSPYTDDEEQKTPLNLGRVPSSPFVPSRSQKDTQSEEIPNSIFTNGNKSNHNANKSVEITLLSNNSIEKYEQDIVTTGIPKQLQNSKSTPHTQSSHLMTLSNSTSTPTPSPKIEEETSPEIKPEIWKDSDNDDDDDDEEQEAKESQPLNTSSLNTSSLNTSTTTYSTPSVLSSQVSASVASSMSQTPEPHRISQPIISTNPTLINKKPDRVAVIIDYGTLQIEARHECKCGYVLSDAQIMVGWCSEFTASNSLKCIMCRQNSFAPKLHLKYNITKMSMQNGICSFESIDKFIQYISPLQLRSKINFILQHRRLDFEDPETFRNKHEEEFWNMIWYFYNRQFDLSFLLGEHDADSLQIGAFQKQHIDNNDNNNNDDNDNDQSLIVLEPKNDDELLLKLKPIYEKATNNKIREAISEWLLNRSQTPSEKRELSIWNLSVFDSFHDLGIPTKFKSYELFIKEFKNACRNIRPKIRDRAWDDPSLAIQHCFKHPRISNQRLQQITGKLTGKPLRPNIPVPVPPSRN